MNSLSFAQQDSLTSLPGVPFGVPPPVRSVSPIIPPPYTPTAEYVYPASGLESPSSPFPPSWIPGYTFPPTVYDAAGRPYFAHPPTPMSPLSPSGLPPAHIDPREVDALKAELSNLQDENDALHEENSELQAKFRSSRHRLKAEAKRMEEEARQLNSENQDLRAELETQSCGSTYDEESPLSSSDAPPNAKTMIRNLKHDLGKELTKNRDMTEELEAAYKTITNLKEDLGHELTSNRALRAELEQGPVRVSDGQIRTLQSLNQRLRKDLRSNQEVRSTLEEEKKRREKLEQEILELRLHVSRQNLCEDVIEEEGVVTVAFYDFQADH